MCAGTGDQFRTGAANINDQALIGSAGRMGDTLINQSGFFFAANYLDRTAEDLLRFSDKRVGVYGNTQCRGGDDADLRLWDILQTFRKQAQALPAAFHGFSGENVVVVQAGSQTHLAFDTCERLDASRHLAYDQHMKTIRAEIDCRIQRSRIHTLHPSTCICVGCVLSPESLTKVSSSGFVFLPP